MASAMVDRYGAVWVAASVPITVWVRRAPRACSRSSEASPIMNWRNPFSDDECSMEEMLSMTTSAGSISSRPILSVTSRSSSPIASGYRQMMWRLPARSSSSMGMPMDAKLRMRIPLGSSKP